MNNKEKAEFIAKIIDQKFLVMARVTKDCPTLKKVIEELLVEINEKK